MLVKIEARILIFPGTDFHFPSTSVPPGTFFRLCWTPLGALPQTPVLGSCSALAMVPTKPLTPSAAYGHKTQLSTSWSTAWAKKLNTKLMAIILPNLNRFSKFFHLQTLKVR